MNLWAKLSDGTRVRVIKMTDTGTAFVLSKDGFILRASALNSPHIIGYEIVEPAAPVTNVKKIKRHV